MTRMAAMLFLSLTAVSAIAQRPLFDADDSLDPRETQGRPVLISRIIIGGASNMAGDGFRPLGEQTGYVHLATNFYWRSVQFDYKRSEMRAEGGETGEWEFDQRRRRDRFHPIRNATPKSKDTLHASWYWPVPGGGGLPVMLRSRLTYTKQSVENDLPGAGELPNRDSSRVRTYALDTDTWFRIAGRDVFGSLAVSRTDPPAEDDAPGRGVRRPRTVHESVRVLFAPQRFGVRAACRRFR